MSTPTATGLTIADLESFPDDGIKREIIGGDLFEQSRPTLRHQRVLTLVGARLVEWNLKYGGQSYVSPSVYFSEHDVVRPDVALVTAQTAELLDPEVVDRPPELVVEVSSPSTIGYDLVRKRALYESHGVAEYWFVDLDAERIETYRLTDGRYPPPTIVHRGSAVAPPHLPGLSVAVNDVLGLGD